MNEQEIAGIIKLVTVLAAAAGFLRVAWAGAGFLFSLKKDMSSIARDLNDLKVQVHAHIAETVQYREKMTVALDGLDRRVLTLELKATPSPQAERR